MSLLAIAIWSVLSVGFTVVRILSFAPAPGFAYRTHPFNPLGLSSDEVLVRVVIGAALPSVWFGLYDFARSTSLSRKALGIAVLLPSRDAMVPSRSGTSTRSPAAAGCRLAG